MLYAYSAATVPKITVVLRKAYGGAYLAMCAKDLGADQVFAWPTAEIAVMGARVPRPWCSARRSRPLRTPRPAGRTCRGVPEHLLDAVRRASRGLVDDIINPEDTRRKVAMALEILVNKRELRPAKKHGLGPA